MDVLRLAVLCAAALCLAKGEEEEFNVFSTLRKSSFSVNLRKYHFHFFVTQNLVA